MGLMSNLTKRFMRETDADKAATDNKSTAELAVTLMDHLEEALEKTRNESYGQIRLAFNIFSSVRENRIMCVHKTLEERAKACGAEIPEGKSSMLDTYKTILKLLEKEQDPSVDRMKKYISDMERILEKADELKKDPANKNKSSIALDRKAAQLIK